MDKVRAYELADSSTARLDRLERTVQEIVKILRQQYQLPLWQVPLPPPVQEHQVNVLEVTKYVEVLDRTLMTKANMNRSSERKSKRQGFFSKKESFKKQNTGSSRTSNSTRNTAPTCNECGKKHRGVCHRISGACYGCGVMDHLVRNCPRNERNVNRFFASVGFVPMVGIANQDRVIALVPESTQNTATAIPGIYTVYK